MILNNDSRVKIGASQLLKAYRGLTAVFFNKSVVITDQMWSFRTFTKQATNFKVQSAFSELLVKTDAPTLDVVGGSTFADIEPLATVIEVYKDGVDNQTIQYVTAENDTTPTRTISLGTGTKLLKFRLGSTQARSIGSAVVGGETIISITAPDGYGLAIQAPPAKKSKCIFFITDSIGVGIKTNNPATLSYVAAMRSDLRLQDYDIVNYGWGNNSTTVLYGNTTVRNALIADMQAYLSGYTEIIVLNAVVTNDYGGSTQTPTAFQSQLSDLTDLLNTTFPSARQIIVTAITRGNETTNNSLGFNLPAYRTAQDVVIAAKSAEKIDGTVMCIDGDLAADKIHPKDYGAARQAEVFTRKALNLPALLRPVFSGQYLVTDPTSTGFVTIPASLNIALAGLSEKTIYIRYRRLRTGQNDYLFCQGSGTAGSLIVGYKNTGQLTFGLFQRTGTFLDASTVKFNIDLNNTHDIILTCNGGTFTLYQDGIFVGTITGTGLQQTTTSQITFGSIATNYGNLAIDRAIIYNKDLSQSERETARTLGTITNFTNMLAAYDFEGNANDITGNGNNGIVGSTATFATS